MRSDEYIRCTQCNNGAYKMSCVSCHYSGWMLPNGAPATHILGETDKWKREKEKERQKNETKTKE